MWRSVALPGDPPAPGDDAARVCPSVAMGALLKQIDRASTYTS